MMRRICAWLLLALMCLPLTVGLTACSGKQPHEDEVLEQSDKLHSQAGSKIVRVLKEPYMGAAAVDLPVDEKLSGVLESRVVLRTKGSLVQVCTAIETMLPLKVRVEQSTPEPSAVPTSTQLDLGIEKISAPSERLAISYEGKLRGLLEFVAAYYGMGWDYDPTGGTVTFAREQVRTFTLLAAPGKITYKNRITNKSRDNITTTGTNSRLNTGQSNSDSTSQTAQTNETEFEADVWTETEKSIKGLLSKTGTISSNPASGTITVRDKASVLRQVARMVDDVNAKLERQVALSVKVWALDISTDSDMGLDLMAMFKNADISLAAGGVLPVASAVGGEVSAAILDGKWKGSTAMLKAMRTHGKATLLTSGSGVTMNNQPMPVQNVNKEAYLAAIGSTQTDYGQTTEITPGEVTVGFAMTVVPHILDRRKVILQYNISLSSLDSMRKFSTGDATVELPKVSTRSFSQRVSMKMGQTLVLAGFEQERHGTTDSLGLMGVGRNAAYGKTLIVITIDVESLMEA